MVASGGICRHSVTVPPNAGETPIGRSLPIPHEKITQIFSTYVIGDSNAIAAGSPSATLATSTGIAAGDFAALVQFLKASGVSHERVEDLERTGASRADRPAAVKVWLAEFTMSAAKSATTAALGVAAKSVAKYLGLPS